MMKKTINLRVIRKIADKYDLVWHRLGGGWVVNGVQQHPAYTPDRAGEKAVLIDYLLKWGGYLMSDEDYDLIRLADYQMQSK